MALPPGVFITQMPRLVAASRSMLSTPTPARPITRSLGALSIMAPSTNTADRTSSASASAKSPFNASFSGVATTQSDCSLNTASADGATFSATTIFIWGPRNKFLQLATGRASPFNFAPDRLSATHSHVVHKLVLGSALYQGTTSVVLTKSLFSCHPERGRRGDRVE